jgi:hypothetical protein
VLDELASLQRSPAAHDGGDGEQKIEQSDGAGLPGKGQVEALYGHVAEAMLSQPATKIFLKTSEPHASEWISKAIGEVEVERFRESRTRGQVPARNSESEQRDITREPLVMASEVAGLDPVAWLLEARQSRLRMRFPYMELASHAEKFVERKMTTPAAATTATAPASRSRLRQKSRVMQSAGAAGKKPPAPRPVQKKQEQEAARSSERAASVLRVKRHGDALETDQLRGRLRRITKRSSPTPKRTTTPKASVCAASGRASLRSDGA